MPEFKGPLNLFGIKSFNSAGVGEKLSDLIKISGAVVIPANVSTVVTSGHVGYDENMALPKDVGEEVMNAFANVEASLIAAGVKDGFRSVYRISSYHVIDPNVPADLEAVEKAVAKYFGTNRPAWTGVGVASLHEGAKIELNAWAALKPEKVQDGTS